MSTLAEVDKGRGILVRSDLFATDVFFCDEDYEKIKTEIHLENTHNLERNKQN